MRKAEFFDIDIVKDIGHLKNADCIMLHGAAERGTRIYQFLRWGGITVDSFYDRNAELMETIGGTPILGMDEIYEFAHKQKGVVYFISCIKSSGDSWEIALHMAECCENATIRFITYWGINFSIYMNKKKLFYDTPKVLASIEKENAYISTWMSKVALFFLENYVGADIKTIWLLQPGKVGSTSIRNLINKAGTYCIQSHTVSYPNYILGEQYRDVWEEMISLYTGEPVKIVTMVREPIARDYSAFWQAFSEGLGERIRIMPGMEGDLQTLYEIYIEMLLKGRANMEEKLGIATPWTWCEEFYWFDDQFNRQLGIDIYDLPFDKDRGYEIVTHGKYEIFIGKLEKIEELFPALKSFVGNENMQFVWDHSSGDKWFSMAYEEFKRRLRIPEKYYRHYYENNSRFKHFYSDKEIEAFERQWIKQVV